MSGLTYGVEKGQFVSCFSPASESLDGQRFNCFYDMVDYTMTMADQLRVDPEFTFTQLAAHVYDEWLLSYERTLKQMEYVFPNEDRVSTSTWFPYISYQDLNPQRFAQPMAKMLEARDTALQIAMEVQLFVETLRIAMKTTDDEGDVTYDRWGYWAEYPQLKYSPEKKHIEDEAHLILDEITSLFKSQVYPVFRSETDDAKKWSQLYYLSARLMDIHWLFVLDQEFAKDYVQPSTRYRFLKRIEERLEKETNPFQFEFMTPDEVKSMGDMKISAVDFDEDEEEYIKAFMEASIAQGIKVPLDRAELEDRAKAWDSNHLTQSGSSYHHDPEEEKGYNASD